MRKIVKRFAMSFAASGILGIAGFFASSAIPEEHHGCMMLGLAGFLWMICMMIAAARQPVTTQLATATGLSWGFLVLVSVAVSINNGRVSVNWPAMLPGLLAIPAAIQLTTLPVYMISKRIHKKQIAEPKDGEVSSESALSDELSS